ncbi:hypothetical protein A2773_06990 [Candidatus Gottesmanbacteria bacterium RIFCSPHIGHO2_01_FULL_39_10]|uniref:DUF4352 domain-containing protein n=1 Tax=Candidatus Gottesmanbacteria bacterium RIFCSPHIGHO2_01_FULL_39_10 TaxID=1798375 RepID=A0A1F5ZQV0_9BACT|nr:MAG: hypothetical protein A2773_06990 [Candidatus Gottesmanbacteria bacterium RIFCSPHIGHO2_01_FULL_39_10]
MKFLKNIPKEYFALLFVIILIIIFSLNDLGKSSQKIDIPKTTLETNFKQEKEQAGVTVIVEYLTSLNSKEGNLVFNIALDTHSVNFDDFEFDKDIILMDNKEKIYYPRILEEKGSGHHRKADVSFDYVPPPFSIIIKNVAAVDKRIFTFDKL